jgi:hypothetical protein
MTTATHVAAAATATMPAAADESDKAAVRGIVRRGRHARIER